jgi:hypothetical protein
MLEWSNLFIHRKRRNIFARDGSRNAKQMHHLHHILGAQEKQNSNPQDFTMYRPSEEPPTLLNISDSILTKLLIVLRALPDRMRSLNTNLPILLPQPRNALHLRLNTEDVPKLINIRTFTWVGATKGRDNFSSDGTECPEGPRTRKAWDYGHWATGTVDELQGFDMVDLFL